MPKLVAIDTRFMAYLDFACRGVGRYARELINALQKVKLQENMVTKPINAIGKTTIGQLAAILKKPSLLPMIRHFFIWQMRLKHPG